MDEQNIKNLILSKYPNIYTEDSIEQEILPNIQKMTPLLKESLEKFLQSGIESEINLLGYTVKTLTKKYGMNEISAYLTLDWILREPTKAIKSLKKGYDVIHNI